MASSKYCWLSWVHPPELRVVRGTVENRGYDVSQRAYILGCPPEEESGDLLLEFKADPDSPLVNALLVLEDWGDSGIDGQRLGPGKRFRPAYRRTLRGTDLLVWLETTSTDPTRIIKEVRIKPVGRAAR